MSAKLCVGDLIAQAARMCQEPWADPLLFFKHLFCLHPVGNDFEVVTVSQLCDKVQEVRSTFNFTCARCPAIGLLCAALAW